MTFPTGIASQTLAMALVKTNRFIIYDLFIRECLNRKRSLWHIGKATNKNIYRYIYIYKTQGSEPNQPPGHFKLFNLYVRSIYLFVLYTQCLSLRL